MRKAKHGNRRHPVKESRHARLLKIIAVLECTPSVIQTKEVKEHHWYCPIYKRECEFPLFCFHLSCLNCFGRLATVIEEAREK